MIVILYVVVLTDSAFENEILYLHPFPIKSQKFALWRLDCYSVNNSGFNILLLRNVVM